MRVLMLCAWLILVSALAAQTADTPAFEVVSVKRNVSGDQASSSIVQPGGRYSATNMTLRMLVKTAYGVHDDQIAGEPGWVLASRDGSFGPRLRRSSNECGGPPKLFPRGPDVPEPIAADGPCHSGFARGGHMAARAMDVSVLVTRLGTFTDRVLVDRTGLAGEFDWDLQWTPDVLAADATNSATAVSLVTALREQLGLRIEPRRESAEVLVIDRASQPVPD